MDGPADNQPGGQADWLGIIAIVAGAGACAVSCIPFLGVLGMPCGLVGAVVGVAAVSLVLRKRRQGMLLPALGAAVSLFALTTACVVSLLAGWWFVTDTNAAMERENQLDLDPPEQVIHVTAQKFWTDYETNAAAADNQYLDRTIEATGVVQSVDRDITGQKYVTFSPRSGFTMSSMQFFFSPQRENELANVQPGKTISVRGRYRSAVGNYCFYNCRLIQ